ncbi:Uncharacterised protein [Vibrio fluvialis]|uniref:Uncharacterized protein n=1 Tax=Vibrio fluvialis TaxID=676 RepID=A0AAX2LNJ8_VIBFL|nr:Uncharacterised protein [Vibrio fluvialis]
MNHLQISVNKHADEIIQIQVLRPEIEIKPNL